MSVGNSPQPLPLGFGTQAIGVTRFEVTTQPVLSTQDISVENIPWFTPLNDPIRRLRQTAWHQDTAFLNTAPDFVPSFQWYESLKEPYLPRLKTRYATALAASSGPTFLHLVRDPSIFAESAQSIGPVFSKTVLYQSFTTDAKFSFVPADVTLFPDKWYTPLSEPVRYRRLQTAAQQDFVYGTYSPLVPFSWFKPLEDPKRLKRTVPWQHFAEFDTFPLPNPFTFGLAWFAPLSEPKRFKRWLRTSDYPLLAQGPLVPIVSFGWRPELEQPVRLKPRLKTTSQQFAFFSPYPIPNPIIDCGHLVPTLSDLADLGPSIMASGGLTETISIAGSTRTTASKAGSTRSTLSSGGDMKSDIPC